MRAKFANHAALVVLLICQVSMCLAAESSNPNESSKYLDAVRTFADNVLEHGRDTYGKSTPLFVDGLNVRTLEPVKWIAPNGDKWILSNLASQQNLFRTLDGLSKITGDPKYRQAAMEAIEYAFANLRSRNGLLYWGNTTAYDAQGDEIVGQRKLSGDHSRVLKSNLPYYELMWQVNPEATKTFIESFWSAHIKDWSNLAMNRIGQFNDVLEEPWEHTYEDGPVFLKSGSGISFLTAGTDLIYAAAILTKLSGDKEPLVWAKRLAHRYVRTRHPKTGISYWMYTEPSFTVLDSYDTVMRKLVPGTMEFLPSEFPWAFYTNPLFREVTRGQFTPTPGISVHSQVFYWQTQFLVGEILAGEGDEFKRWALEELTAVGRASYHEKDNVYVPILTDGTNLEGYVVKVDGLLGPKGVALESVPVRSSDLWAYTMGYRITNDTFMWEMVRNISKGNEFGDIGATPKDRPQLDRDTNCSNPYALLAFLELYWGTGKDEFLYMAKRIGDNILGSRLYKGFFVASNEHIYTKFDAIDSLALLHLHSALAGDASKISYALPSVPYFYCSYRSKEWTNDNVILYTRTEPSDPPLSLLEAVSLGDIEKVRAIISRDSDVNARENSFFKTSLHMAAIKGHKDMVELLLAVKDIDVNARDSYSLTPLHYAIERGHKEIVELLIAKGANINAVRQDGHTPLYSAAQGGHKDVMALLITHGADINAQQDARQDARELTMLHEAAIKGQKELLQLLLIYGADVNAKDSGDRTPLFYALRRGKKEVLPLLLAHGADVNAKARSGITPLDLAIGSGDIDIVELFRKHGAKEDKAP